MRTEVLFRVLTCLSRHAIEVEQISKHVFETFQTTFQCEPVY